MTSRHVFDQCMLKTNSLIIDTTLKLCWWLCSQLTPVKPILTSNGLDYKLYHAVELLLPYHLKSTCAPEFLSIALSDKTLSSPIT